MRKKLTSTPATTNSSMHFKNGYIALTINTHYPNNPPNSIVHPHTLYFGPLTEEYSNLPLDSTVHITNLPLDVSEDQLRFLFKICGKINQVYIGDLFTSSSSSSSSSFLPTDPISVRSVSEQGYIVFASSESLKQLNKIKPQHWIADKALIMGEARYQQLYQAVRGEIQVLESLAKQIMKAYDTKKREEAQLMKQTLMDADGFTLVTKKHASKNPSNSNTEKKSKSKIIQNFYQFQSREAKIKKLKELKEKFDQDKKKLERQRSARKFKPH